MNSKVAFAAALVTLILFLAVAGRTINVSKADTASPLAMPEEYVNYTITRVDGVLSPVPDSFVLRFIMSILLR